MLLPPPVTFPVFVVGLLAGIALTLIPVVYFWVRSALRMESDEIYRQSSHEYERLSKDIESVEDRVFKMFENTSGHMRDQIEIPLATVETTVEDHTVQITDLQNNLNEMRLIVADLQSQIVSRGEQVFTVLNEDVPVVTKPKRQRKND